MITSVKNIHKLRWQCVQVDFIQDDHWNENVGEWASCTADGDDCAMYETNGICMRDETDEGVLWWMRVCFLR